MTDLFLWYASADSQIPAPVREHCASVLSAAELERNSRFVHEADRTVHLLAHAMKRLALSSVCPHMAPGDWRFENGPHGKPAITGMEYPPHFNLSHTRDVAVCAVTMAGPVGIDAEPLSRGADVLRLLDCFATPEERASIAHPEDGVWLWTAKEALVKASGEGLTAMRRSSTRLPLTRWTVNGRYAVTVAAGPGTHIKPVVFLGTDRLAAAAE